MSTAPSSSELADAIEHRQMEELGERVVVKSLLYHLADGERTLGPRPAGAGLLMGEDPRLPSMPEKPVLADGSRRVLSRPRVVPDAVRGAPAGRPRILTCPFPRSHPTRSKR